VIRAAKDSVAGKSARLYLNELIARYGRLETLTIDSREGSMVFTCLLHGEREPIIVRVEQYRIEQQGQACALRLLQCRCERPWVQALLEDFVQEKAFPLPAWAAAALR
jgi:hypothetical protein